jgi:Na+-driven multidrug efflux pump
MCALKVADSTAKWRRMPQHDPTPPLEPLKQQFLKIMRWGALFSFAIAAIAVLLVARGDERLHVHMLIATGLGVGLSVLLGIGLMTLVFLSSRMGQDADAADHRQKDEHDPRS